MKLYDAPRNTRVRTVEGGNEFNFHHVDGAYSYCVDDEGQVVHLAAWTDVEIVEPVAWMSPGKERLEGEQ